MPMPRTVEEILAQADALARRFEEAEPADSVDGAPLRAVREAFEDLALAQKRLAERVAVAKASGHSWASIGAMLGTSGEAARQRYGTVPAKTPAKATAAKRATPAKAAPRAGSEAATKTASANKEGSRVTTATSPRSGRSTARDPKAS
jgi:hypothetical protein